MYPRLKQQASIASTDLRALIRTLYAVVVYAKMGNQVLLNTLRNSGSAAIGFAELIGVDKPLLLAATYIKSRKSIPAEDLSALGASLALAYKQYILTSHRTVSHDDLKLVRAFIAVLRNDNDNAYAWLEKQASIYGDGDIINAFVRSESELPDQRKIERELVQLVKKLTGKNSSAITREEAQAAKEANPELYGSYLKLRRQFNAAWKAYLANYVRASGKNYVPYDEALKAMASAGIKHILPKGFVGFIDDNCVLYTTAGKKINGLPGSDVVMNPDYDPKKDDTFVFRQTNPDTGNPSGYSYTNEFTKRVTHEKHSNIRANMHRVDVARKKWLTKLRSQTLDKTTVAAVVLELLYKFSARIGSVGNQTEGKATFGMSTILGKHVVPTNGGFLIRYPGKAAGKGGAPIVPLRHKLLPVTAIDKLLVMHLSKLMEGKGPKDRVFQYEVGGKTRPLAGNDVNAYFRMVMGTQDVHVHMLRHAIANQLFEQLVTETKFKKNASQTELEAKFKKMVVKVGAALGHRSGSKVTPMTALMSYIDPALSVAFFEERGYRVPKFLEKFRHLAQTAAVDDELETEVHTEEALLPNLRSKVHEEEQLSDSIVVLLEETPGHTLDGHDQAIRRAYNLQGDLIGDPSLGELLANMGIHPDKARPSDASCSIGKSSIDNKWYGWSDETDLRGFGIGDKQFLSSDDLIIDTDADAQSSAQSYAMSLQRTEAEASVHVAKLCNEERLLTAAIHGGEFEDVTSQLAAALQSLYVRLAGRKLHTNGKWYYSVFAVTPRDPVPISALEHYGHVLEQRWKAEEVFVHELQESLINIVFFSKV